MKRAFAIFTFILLLSGSTYSQITAEDAIDLLEQFPAASLDSLLPKTAFFSWFKNVVGSSAKITWEINDCGEQTGVPAVDQGRDLPVCFEISAVLPDRRILGVAIAVGTEKIGTERRTCSLQHLHRYRQGDTAYQAIERYSPGVAPSAKQVIRRSGSPVDGISSKLRIEVALHDFRAYIMLQEPHLIHPALRSMNRWEL